VAICSTTASAFLEQVVQGVFNWSSAADIVDKEETKSKSRGFGDSEGG
jgi:Na+/melibiose symporter-like transporter